MREFDYIAWLRQRIGADPRVRVGPGDDCAVLAPTASPWLVTTDMLLEGSHFILAEAGPRRVGRKALAVNLSDIAAMGGVPVAAVVSLGLPRQGTPGLAEELFEGVRALADEFQTAIVGGDTNSWDGGLAISITLLGVPHAKGPVLRSGARPGDWLFVTGPLGGSRGGKHLDFTPRVREAKALLDAADVHAMIDLSDGLASDLRHICAESGCGAIVHGRQVPINAGRTLDEALGDGEDFELLLAVGAEEGRRLLAGAPTALYHVGECVAGERVLLDGREMLGRGYEHRF